MEKVYDIIIIGGGPAGLAAAIYAGRAKLSCLVLEAESEGGQIISTSEIENYPGCMPDESGQSLVSRMIEQAELFGAEFARDQVISVDLAAQPKSIAGFAKDYNAKAVIIATGAKPARIGCPGEEEFTGLGVSYCATCDAAFFEGLPVYVVGGGDAAVEEALYLTKFASEVTIIHRRDQLRAAKSIQEKAFADPKMHFALSTVVEEIKGEEMMNSMILKNLKDGNRTLVTGDFGLFVFVGYQPNSGLFEGILPLEKGYIRTDDEMRTSVPGVFAAGDIRVKTLRQVVTAVSDGAIAAISAEKYIDSLV